MTLSELRSRFPEYRDLDDEDLLEEVHESSYSDIPFDEFLSVVIDTRPPDVVAPTLQHIANLLAELTSVMKSVKQPEDYSQHFKSLENTVKELSVYMENVKPPVVNVEAPVVHVKPPEVNVAAPVLEAPVITMPKQEVVQLQPVKEWDFKIKRDSNGYIQGVTAIAKEKSK